MAARLGAPDTDYNETIGVQMKLETLVSKVEMCKDIVTTQVDKQRQAHTEIYRVLNKQAEVIEKMNQGYTVLWETRRWGFIAGCLGFGAGVASLGLTVYGWF